MKSKEVKFKGEALKIVASIKDLKPHNIIGMLKEVIKNKNFKKGTIKGSMISNELYLLNEKKAFYYNGWNSIVVCDIKETMESYWDDGINIVYKTENLLLLKDVEMIREFANTYLFDNEDDFEKLLQELGDNIYYEIKTNQEKNLFYIEKNNKAIYVEANENNFYVEMGDYCFSIPFNNPNEDIENFILEKQIEILEKGITKIENGYLYKNKYYETLKEILELEK